MTSLLTPMMALHLCRRELRRSLAARAVLLITTALLALPVSAAGPLDDLFGGSATNEPELLAPEQAYIPVVTHASPEQIEVLWRIEPDYYLYRDKTKASLAENDGARLGQAILDEGTIEHDEFFGDTAVWRHEARIVLPLEGKVEPGSEATLELAWQGCADIGVCFPPKKTMLQVVFDDAPPVAADGASATTGAAITATTLATEGNAAADATSGAGGATVPLESEQGRLASMLASRGLWLSALTFFGLGLLLAFTPCVLPMIPILSSLIVGRGEGMTTGRAFSLSLVYVLVMATTYAIAGIAVGLSGVNIQPALQNPVVLSVIAALFVLLALPMFGVFELQVPRVLQSRLTEYSNKQSSGLFGGVVMMAFISTLIVGPCVTAPLAGALIYIASTGDAVIGGVALFSLGLGMGAPLLLIGTSAGTLLPRAGVWMERVKQVFGVLLLGMAIYMLSRFLSPSLSMVMAGALAVATAILFGATDALTRESGGAQRFTKSVGVIIGVYGLALLIGAFAGGSSFVRPLESLVQRGSSGAQEYGAANHELAFQRIKGPAGLQQAVDAASAAGRPLMLDFYADWCVSCKEMEAFTFTDGDVQNALDNAILVQADVTANDEEDQALLKQFGLFGPPGIIFYNVEGTELPGARVVGFVSAARFASHVRRAIGDPPV